MSQNTYNDCNNTSIEGLPSNAHDCGHTGYENAGPVIGTSATSSTIHCRIMCFTNTACAAVEFDKKEYMCTLKG